MQIELILNSSESFTETGLQCGTNGRLAQNNIPVVSGAINTQEYLSGVELQVFLKLPQIGN